MTRLQAIKTVTYSVLIFAGMGFSALIYVSYQDYVDPKHVYGDWIEVGAPSYDTDVITLNRTGVFKNNRLITTQFKFNGKRVSIETGSGVTVYAVAGSYKSPQLKRISPETPSQRLIKKGYEHTIDMSGGVGGAKARRAALSDHFSGK
ncbi:DUF2850 domain-containing protein [Vibrio marisflavi]|uniref:DUF2850 domain-containing protein n=1 Tax=Vibrio marisflavi CECT 7928 TaxID=634439 RepID=A0ABN8E0U2_9VIBR|nr:DUF2850 domain-containing protein [Vibrio marisflavi]CAH0536303.1 hypothetical protein VMF7928_00319 [Vibrio marisflavi CECT 7928]